MYYAITDTAGKTLDSFRDGGDARHALLAMVEGEPELADEILLIVHSDDGTPIEVFDCRDLRAEVIPHPAPWVFTVSAGWHAAATAAVGPGLALPPARFAAPARQPAVHA